MANLLTSMRSAAMGLGVFERAASASQNNVTNASTPGYARQVVRLKAAEFEPDQGLAGGVLSGSLSSLRDEFAEAAVRKQTSSIGEAEEKASQLSWIDSTFSLNDSTGISANLDKLFSAFSAWSVSPLNTSSKENVLAAAQSVAAAFNRTAGDIQQASQNSETRIGSTLSAIGDIAERIRQHNVDRRNGGAADAGVDATMHADLEELSSLVDIHTIWQTDGTATVLVGNQTPLVIGDRSYKLGMTTDNTPPPPGFEGAVPQVRITDQNGADVTGTVTGGKLAGLLQFRNSTIPSYLGDTNSPGDLNRLAKAFADRVNDLLTDGDPAIPAPEPLFTYVNDVSAALTLRVNPSVQASKLSAGDPLATTPDSNGRALKLAALARPLSEDDMLDGISFISFTGKISSGAGRLASEASAAVNSHRQMLAQTQTMRDAISGVSLDEEAISLVQSQRAYQATARMINTLDEMTQTAINIGRQ